MSNDYEILGEDFDLEGAGDDDEILGAAKQILRRRKGGFFGAGVFKRPGGRVVARPQLPMPGSPQEFEKAALRSFMGLGTTSWTGADGADKTLIVEPQENFRVERLVIRILESAAPAGISLVRRVEIGSTPQSPSTEFAMPASMFAHDATDASLMLEYVAKGQKFSVVLGQSAAPGGAVVVTIAAGVYGTWIK